MKSMKSMKILLVWPSALSNIEERQQIFPMSEPLALEYLAAAAEEEGHVVQIFDMRLNSKPLSDVIASFGPDIVGVTAYSMHVRTAISITNEIKSYNQMIITIVGGHHATLLPEDFFEPSIDYVVVGEGITAFKDIIGVAAENKLSREVLPGAWTQIGGEFHDGGRGETLGNDMIPLPNREITGPERIHYFIDWMKPVALLRTSIGCPYRCTFCSLWKIEEGRYHIRNPHKVVKELKTIQEPYIFLVDDEAFINRRRMIELAGAIKESGIKKKYFAYCRMDTLVKNQAALEAWRDIGLERVFIGIDSITTKGLKELNKKYDTVTIEEGLKVAKEIGVKVFAQFIVSTDYEDKDFDRLIRFIEQYRIEYPSFTVLTPLPGTELLSNFDLVTELQDNGRPNWDLFDTDNPVVKTKLPKSYFVERYEGLWRTFAGSHNQFEDHQIV